MKNWIRSLFRDGSSPPEKGKEDQPTDDGNSFVRASPGATAPLVFEGVLDDLVQWVCTNSSQGMTREDVDPDVHLYDAGYVDSMRGAELLVHIEERYRVFIPETGLVGELSQLRSLVEYIVAAGEVNLK